MERSNKAAAEAAKENAPVFKTGNSLPTVAESTSQPNLKGKANAMFDDLSEDDEKPKTEFTAKQLMNLNNQNQQRKEA